MSVLEIIVRPASHRGESYLLAASVVILLLASAILIEGNQVKDGAPRLFNWQISAFHDLDTTDQAIYTQLVAAAEELWWIHSDFLQFADPDNPRSPWPTITELDEDFVLPPFVHDVSWSQLGSVNWRLVAAFSFEGSTVYMGTDGTVPGQAAYLVMLTHAHKGASYTNGATIWINRDPHAREPDTIVRESLILNGWKEVVPYTGASEVERLKG